MQRNRFSARASRCRSWVFGTLLLLVAGGELSNAADQTTRVTLRLRFGMRDTAPTDWSGKRLAGSGRVEAIRGWRWMHYDAAEGNTWSVRTRRKPPLQDWFSNEMHREQREHLESLD